MVETATLGLTLLEAAQAQKHVTVNEALLRLDAGVAVTADGVGVNAPPAVVDGEVYVVGGSPTDAWAGQADMIAFAVGGGWSFITPSAGRVVTDRQTGQRHVFDGTGWRHGLVAGTGSGAYTVARVIEVDEAVAASASHVSGAVIPANSVVIGVTGRVVETLGGPSSWTLGVAGAPDRYGSGLGTVAGSYALGLTGSPLAYYSDTPVVLTATGAAFTNGRVLIAIHLIEILPPVAL